MRRRVYLPLFLVVSLLTLCRTAFHVPLPGISQQATAGMAKRQASAEEIPAHWESVTPGISYCHMELPGPVQVFISRADRSKDTWTIDSMTSMGIVKGGMETVPDMARRYDETVTSDGHRYEVKVAINGNYFNMHTGYSFGGFVHAGWYAKRFPDYGGMSGFFWRSDRQCAIGGDVLNGPKLQQVTFADNDEMNINTLNDGRGKDELALYTFHWDSTTGTDNNGAEVLVRMDKPLAVNPKSPGNRGVILKVAKDAGSTPIPFGCVVLSATGTAASRLLKHAKEGSAVHFNMRLRDVGVERYGLKPVRWENVWGSIGDTQNFVVNGLVPKHWEEKAKKYAAQGKRHGSVIRAPRTMIAYTKYYVYFVVIDGRTEESIGMTFTEAAEFCQKVLKADFAVNQDGGGSSTMWVDGQVRNTPSDRRQNDKDAKGGQPGVLRRVADGYLIALVHPPKFSDVLKAGSKVKAKTAVELKLGPGSHFGAAGKVAAGASGHVLEHRLDGVYAKGANWWPVEFGDVQGWVAEGKLQTGE